VIFLRHVNAPKRLHFVLERHPAINVLHIIILVLVC